MKSIAILCSSTALAIAMPAFAQDGTTDSDRRPGEESAASRGDDIVVTARRREESLQSVPIAVTALSDEKLQQNRVTNVSDLTTQAPSLHINTMNRRSTPILAIRGLRQSDVLLGQDAAVGFYVNEVAFSYTPGINQGMFDLQSVQVLKGAQGTLFGRNSTGGAILVSTQRPTDALEGYVMMGLSDFSHGQGMEAEGALNLPISDKAQFRVAGRYVNREGYVVNTAPRTGMYADPRVNGTTDYDRAGDERSVAVRGSLRLVPTDSLTNDTVVQYSRIRENGAPFVIAALNPAGYAQFGYGQAIADAAAQIAARRDFWSYETNQNGAGDTRSLMLSNTTAFETGNITIKNIFGYRHVKVADFQDFDGTAFPVLDAANLANVKELSDELQLQGETEGGSSYVLGAYYYRQKGTTDDRSSVFGDSPTSQGGHVRNTSKALFAQVTVPLGFLTEKLTLTAGGRYSWDRRSARVHPIVLETGQCFYVDANGSTPANDACYIPGKVSYNTPTWTAGLDYKADPDTLIYLVNRRGFRSGGFNLRATNALEYAPFRPEKVTDYELGLKRTWNTGAGTLRTNFAVFHTEYSGVQRFVVSNTALAVTTVINAASARVNGGEAEIDWQITPAFNISGFYSYVDAKYKDFVTGTGDFTRNHFAQVPKHSGSVTARYALPVSSDIGEVALQGNVYAQSRTFFSDVEQSSFYGPLSSVSQKGYTLVNLRLEWNEIFGSKAGVAIYATNLTNKKYYANGVNLYQSLGLNVKSQGDPRVIGMTLKTAF